MTRIQFAYSGPTGGQDVLLIQAESTGESLGRLVRTRDPETLAQGTWEAFSRPGDRCFWIGSFQGSLDGRDRAAQEVLDANRWIAQGIHLPTWRPLGPSGN